MYFNLKTDKGESFAKRHCVDCDHEWQTENLPEKESADDDAETVLVVEYAIAEAPADAPVADTMSPMGGE